MSNHQCCCTIGNQKEDSNFTKKINIENESCCKKSANQKTTNCCNKPGSNDKREKQGCCGKSSQEECAPCCKKNEADAKCASYREGNCFCGDCKCCKQNNGNNCKCNTNCSCERCKCCDPNENQKTVACCGKKCAPCCETVTNKEEFFNEANNIGYNRVNACCKMGKCC